MIHLCQAEIEMLVLASSVIRNPNYGKNVAHIIRGYMFQLIEEILNVRKQTAKANFFSS